MGKAKTNEEFTKQVYGKVGDEYTFLEHYVRDKVRILCRHNTCGNEYKVLPGSFLRGSRCAKCVRRQQGEANRKTHEKFIEEVNELGNGEYQVLERYTNSDTKISLRHTTCGYEYKVRPDAFLSGTRCTPCRHKQMSIDNTKTTDQFAKEVEDLGGGEYMLLSEYITVHTKVTVKHLTCDHQYEVLPFLFLRGRRCPKCGGSKGEKITNRILSDLGLHFTTKKTFPDLIDIKQLSYDFCIPDSHTLIEYQGIQHYEPVDLFGGEEQFIIQQRHDSLKREYARNNDFYLIEIPYTEDTYDKIKQYLLNRMK